MMRYLLACVHSWWWHLTYGMWKGYRETRTYYFQINGHETMVALTSTDKEHRIVRVFWRHDLCGISNRFEKGSK